jgi:hypothetical protein
MRTREPSRAAATLLAAPSLEPAAFRLAAAARSLRSRRRWAARGRARVALSCSAVDSAAGTGAGAVGAAGSGAGAGSNVVGGSLGVGMASSPVAGGAGCAGGGCTGVGCAGAAGAAPGAGSGVSFGEAGAGSGFCCPAAVEAVPRLRAPTASQRTTSVVEAPTPERPRHPAGGLILHSGAFGSTRVTLLGRPVNANRDRSPRDVGCQRRP